MVCRRATLRDLRMDATQLSILTFPELRRSGGRWPAIAARRCSSHSRAGSQSLVQRVRPPRQGRTGGSIPPAGDCCGSTEGRATEQRDRKRWQAPVMPASLCHSTSQQPVSSPARSIFTHTAESSNNRRSDAPCGKTPRGSGCCTATPMGVSDGTLAEMGTHRSSRPPYTLPVIPPRSLGVGAVDFRRHE